MQPWRFPLARGLLVDTRESIRKTFMGLYARERLDRITVKGLCTVVPVARTTFYAHYRNVDDVLVEVEDKLLAGLAEVTDRVSGGNLPGMDYSAFLDATFGFIGENWSDFRALLVVQPDARFVSRWKDAVKANLARRYPGIRRLPTWDLVAEVSASATIGAYTYWMRQPDHSGMEEAKRLAERVIEVVMAAI